MSVNMKLLFFALLCSLAVNGQNFSEVAVNTVPVSADFASLSANYIPTQKEKIRISPEKWRITKNHLITGGLVFFAGASKGFNETLMFHWKGFYHTFDKVNPQWFNPNDSWRNKYKNGDPDAGAKFPLSTTFLVMFTDQYHLNSFINKAAWSSALVIKIGEGKRPLKHYLLDLLYYGLCHQLGFILTYYPFKDYRE
jgi:hypothetical protein